MRQDNRPYTLVRLLGAYSDWYARRFVHPQFESIGKGSDFRKPTCLEIVGPRVSVGDYFHAMATKDGRIRLVTWPETEGRIEIGSYVALSPGVRIKSASSVKIGDSCVIAENVYITDADWHGIYERIYPPGEMAPVEIGNNVWISDRATVLKGVRIGDNSIVAAGAVVTSDVPPDTIVGGVPSRSANWTPTPDTPRDATCSTRKSPTKNSKKIWNGAFSDRTGGWRGCAR